MRIGRIARAAQSESQTHSRMGQRCDGLAMQRYPFPVVTIAFLTAIHFQYYELLVAVGVHTVLIVDIPRTRFLVEQLDELLHFIIMHTWNSWHNN
jgi:hypothetical protein